MTRISLLGCGNIGRIIARRPPPRTPIVAVCDAIAERAQAVGATLGARPCADFDELLRSGFDLVLAATSIGAVESFAETILGAGEDLIVLSVGALSILPLLDQLDRPLVIGT